MNFALFPKKGKFNDNARESFNKMKDGYKMLYDNKSNKNVFKKMMGQYKALLETDMEFRANPKDYKVPLKSQFYPNLQFSIEALGFLSFNIIDGGISGGIIVKPQFEGQIGGMFTVMGFPMFWEGKFGASGELSLVWGKESFKKDSSFILSFFAQLGVGAGLNGIASVQINNKFKYDIGWNFEGENIANALTYYLFIEIEFFFFKHNFPIFEYEWDYTKKAKLMERTISNNSGNSANTISNDAFQNAKPQTCMIEDKMVAAWISDDKIRDDFNRTVLNYSVCENGIWTSPKAVFDDGKADFYPSIVNFNNELYVTWQKTTKILSEDNSLDELTSSAEILVSKFDDSSLQFMKPTQITNNLYLDTIPKFINVDNSLKVFWQANSLNNPFGASGTDMICESTLEQNSWSNAKILFESEERIVDFDSAVIDGEQINTCLVDNGIEFKVYLQKNNGVTEILSDKAKITSLQFDRFENKVALLYKSELGINYTYDFLDSILIENTLNVPCYFTVNSSDDGTFVSYCESVEGKNELVTIRYENKFWTTKTLLLSSKSNIKDYNLLFKDDKIEIISLQSENDSYFLKHNTCTLINDLKIETAYFFETPQEGNPFTIEVIIKNAGQIAATKCEILVDNKKYLLFLIND